MEIPSSGFRGKVKSSYLGTRKNKSDEGSPPESIATISLYACAAPAGPSTIVGGNHGLDIPATYLKASNSTGPGEPANTLGEISLVSIL